MLRYNLTFTSLLWCRLMESNQRLMLTRQLLYHLTTRANWSQWLDSNQRYLAPKASDLARLAYTEIVWWRLGDSNSSPSACKADVLPNELNPHKLFWSRIPGSNRSPTRWQRVVLPNELILHWCDWPESNWHEKISADFKSATATYYVTVAVVFIYRHFTRSVIFCQCQLFPFKKSFKFCSAAGSKLSSY